MKTIRHTAGTKQCSGQHTNRCYHPHVALLLVHKVIAMHPSFFNRHAYAQPGDKGLLSVPGLFRPVVVCHTLAVCSRVNPQTKASICRRTVHTLRKSREFSSNWDIKDSLIVGCCCISAIHSVHLPSSEGSEQDLKHASIETANRKNYRNFPVITSQTIS